MAARNLIKFITKVDVRHSVFDTRCSGASEFYRQMTAPKTVGLNPKCAIEFIPVVEGTEPTIDLEFINGKKESFDVANVDVRDIFAQLQPPCMAIEEEYENAGKTIE